MGAIKTTLFARCVARRRMGKKKRDAAKRDTRTKAQRTGNVPLWPSKEFWTAAEAQNSATQGTRDKRLAQGRLLHIPPLSNAVKRWSTAPKKAGSYPQIAQMANPNKQAAALALRKWHSLHFKNGIASLAVGGYVAARWFNIVENATARALYGKELQVDPPYPWPPIHINDWTGGPAPGNNTTTTGFITAAAVFAVSFRLQGPMVWNHLARIKMPSSRTNLRTWPQFAYACIPEASALCLNVLASTAIAGAIKPLIDGDGKGKITPDEHLPHWQRKDSPLNAEKDR